MRLSTHLSITAVLFLVMFPACAQPGDPRIDLDVPITGIEILISTGVVVGLRNLRKKNCE